jgi:hypothetical protein
MAQIRAFAFQAAKESLGYRIVQTFALATHATTKARGCQQPLVVMTDIYWRW